MAHELHLFRRSLLCALFGCTIATAGSAAEEGGWTVVDGAEGAEPYVQAVLLDQGGALVLRCQKSASRLSVFILPEQRLGASLLGAPEYRRFRYVFDRTAPRETLWSYNDTAISLRHPGEAATFAGALLRSRSLTATLFRRDGRSLDLAFGLPQDRSGVVEVAAACGAGPAPVSQ
jgi:hypothetical protein